MLRGCRTAALLCAAAFSSEAQVCRLSVAGLNQSRRVTGAIHAECPEDPVHSPPFGNWGVTSNFGQKGDSHQFDGWCHNTRVCDNAGACRVDCQDGWYEWNSCTDHPLYRAPNCTLFNDASCSEQASATGVNVHGTKYIDVRVRCPSDTNGDGVPDQGGCADVTGYNSGANFLSLYELDPVCCDQLVQTVYFPQTTVPLSCDVFGCAPAGSAWLQPSSWDSPASPAKVFAEVAVVVNWGGFVDSGNACRTAAQNVPVVSSASFTGPNVAPESIASAFGQELSPATAEAGATPLPTSLAGISLRLTDRTNTTRAAPLFYVSPGQLNFLVPTGTAAGAATVAVYSGDILRSKGTLQVETVAPGLYAANANGKGVAAATALRVTTDGSVIAEPVFTCAGTGQCVAQPLDLGGATDSVYLTLYGTGIRNAGGITAVAATIGGEKAAVTYAGPQPQFVGLDQVNLLVPPQVRGRGVVDIALTVGSKPANVVQIAIR